jgi:membrane fusion protein (multidrug efflux system)
MERSIQLPTARIEQWTYGVTQKFPVKFAAPGKLFCRPIWINYRQALTDRSIFAALIFLVGAATCFSGCKKPAPAQAPPPQVEVMEIVPTNVPASAEFIGQLDSPQNVEVRARVEGFVDKMLFTEGSEVREGDALFKLDDKPFKERLAAAQGSLAEAKAALAKYEKDVARLTPLAQKRAVPQQDLDNALAAQDVGKAGVLTAQARVDSAIIDLGYCDIRSPVTGLIGAKQVSIGDLVGKGQPTLLATISTLDPIWFYCNVSEVDYLKAQEETRRTGRQVQDMPVSLILVDGTTLPDQGRFVFIDRAVDPKTGTLRVRAAFPNPRKQLRPGMFARIRVDLGSRSNSIVVPERSVVELQGKNFMWLVSPDNKTTQRPVEVGSSVGQDLLITDGLKPGDRIVVEGLQKVRDGGPVKPMTAQEMASATQSEEKLTPTGK